MFLKKYAHVAAVSSTFSALLVSAVLFSGCPQDPGDGSQPPSHEEEWVAHFKDTLNGTEQRFFEQRYIQRSVDPFYINEVVPRLATDKPISKALRAQINIRKQDYKDSWPVLTEQLARTQMIFAITAVLPAYKAMGVLDGVNGELNLPMAVIIGHFKELVKTNSVFDPETQLMEISPHAKSEILALAGKIVTKTLKNIDAVQSQVAGTKAAAALELYGDELRLLYPEAAEAAGHPVNAQVKPFIEEPTKNWKLLGTTYEKIFSLLDEAQQAPKIDEIRALQAEESKTLEKVVFATEKQFAVAKMATKKE